MVKNLPAMQETRVQSLGTLEGFRQWNDKCICTVNDGLSWEVCRKAAGGENGAEDLFQEEYDDMLAITIAVRKTRLDKRVV